MMIPLLFLIFLFKITSAWLDDLVGSYRVIGDSSETFGKFVQFGDDVEFQYALQSIEGAIATRNKFSYIDAYAVIVDQEGLDSMMKQMENGIVTQINDDILQKPLFNQQMQSVDQSLHPDFSNRLLKDRYNLDLIQIPEAHQHTKGEGVKICIIDSGVDIQHIDLDTKTFSGLNTDSELEWNIDLIPHGTHIAGIISAVHDNAFEVEGIAPDADIFVIRVFDNSYRDFEFASGLVKSVERCAIAGAKIINMSLGGFDSVDLEQRDFSSLVDKFALLIVAAGGNNGFTAKPFYPASYEDVVSVGAIDKLKFRWFGSQSFVDIVAPGVEVLGLVGGTQSGFERQSGTSIACAYISGVAALLWSWNPSATLSEIKTALFNTAEVLGSGEGKDAEFGYGMVQAMCALIHINGGSSLKAGASIPLSCPPYNANIPLTPISTPQPTIPPTRQPTHSPTSLSTPPPTQQPTHSTTSLSTPRDILGIIYTATNGYIWNQHDNWLTLGNHCTWFGVDCNTDDEVTGLI